MLKYKKNFLYVCSVLLIVGCIACKPESRRDTAQTCAAKEKTKTGAGAEKPVAQIVFDDKALAALSKQKATVIYCIAMGAS